MGVVDKVKGKVKERKIQDFYRIFFFKMRKVYYTLIIILVLNVRILVLEVLLQVKLVLDEGGKI